LLGLLPLDFKSEVIYSVPDVRAEPLWTVSSKSKVVHRMTCKQKKALLTRLCPSDSLLKLDTIEGRVTKLMADIQALQGLSDLAENKKVM
jgi:hypothetical protein